MKKHDIDTVTKAIMDGVAEMAEIAELTGVAVEELNKYEPEVERAIQLMRGFYKFGHENMTAAGQPPPKNPYLDKALPIDEQKPEYYAYEAVCRGCVNSTRCIWICEQFGLSNEVAKEAVENVIMPWRESNNWRTYAIREKSGQLVLQDKTPVKLHRHIARFREALAEERD